MKTWYLWDFPDNIYIFLKKDVHDKFFNTMFEKYGGKRPYARFLGISQMGMKQYWRRYTKKNGMKYIQYTPLWVLKKSCETNELKKLVERGIAKMRLRGGNPLFLKNLKLPIKESPALHRIVAHLLADGFAGKRKVPYYSNTCKYLRKQFKKDLEIFGKINTYERTPNTTPCVMFPKFIADILKHIFNIDFVRPSKLPKEIFNATEECKREFLKALFDDEGHISTNLGMGMSNLNIIKEIKKLVESLGIDTNKISVTLEKSKDNHFAFTIKRKFLITFREKIGFDHPEKIKNLNFAIKTQNRKQRTRDPKEIEQKIIDTLKNKQMKTIEIANNVQLTPGYTLRFLKKIKKKNIIKMGGYKNRIIWSLL